MKYFLIILFVVIQIAGRTQTRQTPQRPSSKVEKTLIQNLYNFTNAWARSDTATLTKLLAPEYRHTDIFGKIQQKKEWLDFASGKRDVADLKISDVDIIMYSDNLTAITGS